MHEPGIGEGSPVDSVSRRAVLRGIGLGGVATALLAAGWKVETVAQKATPAAVEAEPNAIVVLFRPPTDVEAFEDYYFNQHRPLALTMPGLQDIVGGPVLATLDGSEPEYHRIAILRYANAADLQESVMSDIGQETFADVANFATGGITAFLTRLESSPATGAAATPAS